MTKAELSIEERLQKHPYFLQRITSLLEIVEDSDGDLDLADAAEQRVIEELQQLGKEALQSWSFNKESEKNRQFVESNNEIKDKGKKKSIGIRSMGK